MPTNSGGFLSKEDDGQTPLSSTLVHTFANPEPDPFTELDVSPAEVTLPTGFAIAFTGVLQSGQLECE